jgi:hypothetical protein
VTVIEFLHLAHHPKEVLRHEVGPRNEKICLQQVAGKSLHGGEMECYHMCSCQTNCGQVCFENKMIIRKPDQTVIQKTRKCHIAKWSGFQTPFEI